MHIWQHEQIQPKKFKLESFKSIQFYYNFILGHLSIIFLKKYIFKIVNIKIEIWGPNLFQKVVNHKVLDLSK